MLPKSVTLPFQWRVISASYVGAHASLACHESLTTADVREKACLKLYIAAHATCVASDRTDLLQWHTAHGLPALMRVPVPLPQCLPA